MTRRLSLKVPILCAIVGLTLAVLGAALIASGLSTDRAQLDRALDTTAGEKAAVVEGELERLRALAVITARVPPFSEFYANSGSLAAKIAAVAGPFREVNNALSYVYLTSPSRYVEVGYVDVSGMENARVVRGVKQPRTKLQDVRSWPSFAQGVRTPVGTVRITMPFVSPAAHLPVIAGTTTVSVNGRIRAYVELELTVTTLQGILASDVPAGIGVQIVDRVGNPVTAVGRRFAVPAGALTPGLDSERGLRLAARTVADTGLAAGPWYVVAATRNPSALSAVSPEHVVILLLALLLLASAFITLRRVRSAHAAELAAAEAARVEAERQARIDGLTGLFNRRHAMETIDHELDRASREGGAVAMLMFDVDFFKRVNDAHGHIGGDAVLIEVARRLRTGVRSWDTVARMGGEEFCVVAPGLENEVPATELANRLRGAIAQRAISVAPGVAVPVTVSVGVAVLHPGDGSAEYALDCADRALYAAKRRGRNRICHFSELDRGDLRAEQPECLHLAEALAIAGDLREGLTSYHSREVAELSGAVAERLGMDQEETLKVRLGGWLHDVGKIAVPDGILTKPGKFTQEEWKVMRAHPVVGDELLRNFPELALACKAVRHHHERFDGAGYPDGLKGEQIPLEARIVGTVDAYSAMIAERPYSEALTADEAIAELERCAGTQFDPVVVEALREVLENVRQDARASDATRF